MEFRMHERDARVVLATAKMKRAQDRRAWTLAIAIVALLMALVAPVAFGQEDPECPYENVVPNDPAIEDASPWGVAVYRMQQARAQDVSCETTVTVLELAGVQSLVGTYQCPGGSHSHVGVRYYHPDNTPVNTCNLSFQWDHHEGRIPAVDYSETDSQFYEVKLFGDPVTASTESGQQSGPDVLDNIASNDEACSELNYREEAQFVPSPYPGIDQITYWYKTYYQGDEDIDYGTAIPNSWEQNPSGVYFNGMQVLERFACSAGAKHSSTTGATSNIQWFAYKVCYDTTGAPVTPDFCPGTYTATSQPMTWAASMRGPYYAGDPNVSDSYAVIRVGNGLYQDETISLERMPDRWPQIPPE